MNRIAGRPKAEEYIVRPGHEVLPQRCYLLVRATSPVQAAEIANTVWTEAGADHKKVCVVKLSQPETRVGLIYEPVCTPNKYVFRDGKILAV